MNTQPRKNVRRRIIGAVLAGLGFVGVASTASVAHAEEATIDELRSQIIAVNTASAAGGGIAMPSL